MPVPDVPPAQHALPCWPAAGHPPAIHAARCTAQQRREVQIYAQSIKTSREASVTCPATCQHTMAECTHGHGVPPAARGDGAWSSSRQSCRYPVTSLPASSENASPVTAPSTRLYRIDKSGITPDWYSHHRPLSHSRQNLLRCNSDQATSVQHSQAVRKLLQSPQLLQLSERT